MSGFFDVTKYSDEELDTNISKLQDKLYYAEMSGNTGLANQIDWMIKSLAYEQEERQYRNNPAPKSAIVYETDPDLWEKTDSKEPIKAKKSSRKFGNGPMIIKSKPKS